MIIVIVVKLVLEVSIFSIISVCAPQAGCLSDEKNVFWRDLDKVM